MAFVLPHGSPRGPDVPASGSASYWTHRRATGPRMLPLVVPQEPLVYNSNYKQSLFRTTYVVLIEEMDHFLPQSFVKHYVMERVPWFSPVDYEILEFFYENNILASPKVIAENIGYDRQYTSKHCRILLEANILSQKESGLYETSSTGDKFLENKISASELEEPDKI